jgi:hypothetical protein
VAKTVADQFVETLAAVGIKRIYGIVGDSLNGLTDSIRRQCGQTNQIGVSAMIRCIRLWSGLDGESHFEEGAVDLEAGPARAATR